MQKYECKKCGAELYWNAEAGALKCEYCDSVYSVSDFEDKTLEENLVDESLDSTYTSQTEDFANDMVVYACNNCGAEVITTKITIATTCAYCGSPISISNKAAGNFRPNVLIPFSVKKEKAKDIYRSYLKTSFLAPKSFYDEAVIEKMQGLYVPFWLYTSDASAKALYKCEHTTSRKLGDDKVTTHKIYNVSLDVNGNFERVPADASKKLDNNLMNSLEPFSYYNIKNFNPAYMSGFYAEQPDETKEDMFPQVKERMAQALKETSYNAITGYESKQLIDYNDIYNNLTAEHAMLPVWLLNVSHKNQKYTFAVNGDTGKVVGKIPVDYPKLIRIGCGCFFGSQIAILLFKLIMSFLG